MYGFHTRAQQQAQGQKQSPLPFGLNVPLSAQELALSTSQIHSQLQQQQGGNGAQSPASSVSSITSPTGMSNASSVPPISTAAVSAAGQTSTPSSGPLSASVFFPGHLQKLQQNLVNLQSFNLNNPLGSPLQQQHVQHQQQQQQQQQLLAHHSKIGQGLSLQGPLMLSGGGNGTVSTGADTGAIGNNGLGGSIGMGMGMGGVMNLGDNTANTNTLGMNVMSGQITIDEEKVYALVLELQDTKTREQALLELSKRREHYDELALVLWHSFGTMAILIQEIISCYPLLSPPTLTSAASNRVCNALALLQCVASHPETRVVFLHAHIPLFLYPFLNTTSKTRPFEYLRLTSLGVIGALVKNDSTEVITFLLSTEIIPLCLRIMETGSELSKIVAIFIVQKILLDDVGLSYICQTYERFYAVGTVLSNMVMQLVETQSVRLLKHVVRCYLRLSDNPRAREALRQCLPGPLRDATFSAVLKDDITTKRCLGQLLVNLSDPLVTS